MHTHPAPPRRTVRVFAVLVALLVTFGLMAGWTGTAGAAGGDPLQIRKVDSTDPSKSTIEFLYDGNPSDVRGASLTDNGNQVDTTAPTNLADTARIGVALVFDTSSALDDSGALVSAKAAARKWIQGRSAAEQANQLVGVYTAADVANQIQSPTSDTGRILAAIDRVAPTSDAAKVSESAMWGAIRLAGDALDGHDQYQANVVMITGSGDTVGGSRSAANGALANAGASLFAVEQLGDGFRPGALDSMVHTNGGLVLSTETGTDLGSLVTQVGTTIDDHQFTMGFAAATDANAVSNLDLTVADHTAQAAVVVGSSVVGATSLDPDVLTSAGGVSLLQGPLGLFLLIGVGLIAAIALAYGVIMIFVKEDRLSTALQPYDEVLAPTDFDDDDVHGGSALAKSALIQRAVQLTEHVAEQRGFLGRTEAALERANLPLRAGEALFFYGAVVVVATLLVLVVTASVILGLIVGLIAALTPGRQS